MNGKTTFYSSTKLIRDECDDGDDLDGAVDAVDEQPHLRRHRRQRRNLGLVDGGREAEDQPREVKTFDIKSLRVTDLSR